MRLRLRDYHPDDFDTLWKLDQICFPEDISYTRSELSVYITLRTAFAIVAECEQKVAGFIVVDARPSRPAYIVTIDVDPQQRRSGVASALLAETEQRLARQEIRSIRLEVAEDNDRAIAFYRKHGFFEIGRKEGYYNGRLNAISMRKELAKK